jgi:hypothetical protein
LRFFIFSLLRIICLSALINNVAAIAIFAPIVMGVARRKKWSPAQFLMPLAFGSILGGTCTLIGTSTNVAISSSDCGCRNIFVSLVDQKSIAHEIFIGTGIFAGLGILF